MIKTHVKLPLLHFEMITTLQGRDTHILVTPKVLIPSPLPPPPTCTSRVLLRHGGNPKKKRKNFEVFSWSRFRACGRHLREAPRIVGREYGGVSLLVLTPIKEIR
jgi:hypothetical protein